MLCSIANAVFYKNKNARDDSKSEVVDFFRHFEPATQ